MVSSGHAAGAGAVGAGARQSSIRALNLSTVLRQVFAAPAPVSRADVASTTGLTRSTVSRLVDELLEHGLVAECDPVMAGQRGRPAVPLVAAPDTWLGLGLEVNIRHLAARLVDLTGAVVDERIVAEEFGGSDPRATIARLAGLAAELLEGRQPAGRLAGIQLALPGLVDGPRGLLLRAPNLGWWEVAALAALREELPIAAEVPLGLGNEADYAAATVARTAPGRTSALSDFLYVSGEVGIGSAVVTSGRVTSGRHGWAGEIGHVCVERTGPRCGCGANGCLEAYAGQRALCAAAGVADQTALLAALDARDERALAAVGEAGEALGIAVAAALNLLDVSTVVLGGHLGELAPHLAAHLHEQLNTRVLAAPFDSLNITTVALDQAPAARGAAWLALERLLNDPVEMLDALAGLDARSA